MMNRFALFASLLAGGLLVACSASNTPVDAEKQDDAGATELTGPVASEIENGQQFATSGRAATLATLMSTEITDLLNTLNMSVISGTTENSALAGTCLAEFDGSFGKPATDFSCDAEVD